jgi:hypothetical protein
MLKRGGIKVGSSQTMGSLGVFALLLGLLVVVTAASAQEAPDSHGDVPDSTEVIEEEPSPAPTATPEPSATATASPTETATPPTATPTVIPTADSGPRPHTLPEPRPTVGPRPPSDAVSTYFVTSFAGFAAREPTGQERWTAGHVLILEPAPTLPASAFLEAHFESPNDPDLALIGQRQQSTSSRLTFTTEPMAGIKCRNYYAEVHVYSDASKTTELGKHVQWIRSAFDIDRVRSQADLFDRRSC